MLNGEKKIDIYFVVFVDDIIKRWVVIIIKCIEILFYYLLFF